MKLDYAALAGVKQRRKRGCALDLRASRFGAQGVGSGVRLVRVLSGA